MITLISRLFVERKELKKQIFSALKPERRVSWFLSTPVSPSPPTKLVRILIRRACFRVAPHFPSTTLVWQDLFFSLPYPEPGLLKILKYSPFFLASVPFSSFLSFSPSFHGRSSSVSSSRREFQIPPSFRSSSSSRGSSAASGHGLA